MAAWHEAEDAGEAARAETRHAGAVRRAEADYAAKVDARRGRAERRGDLAAEFAAVAEEMVALSRRGALSAQQIATARRLTAQGERLLRLMETEQT